MSARFWEPAIACFSEGPRAGKAVSLQKPLARDLGLLTEIVDTADATQYEG